MAKVGSGGGNAGFKLPPPYKPPKPPAPPKAATPPKPPTPKPVVASVRQTPKNTAPEQGGYPTRAGRPHMGPSLVRAGTQRTRRIKPRF